MKFILKKIKGFTNKNIKPGEYFVYVSNPNYTHEYEILQLTEPLATNIDDDDILNVVSFGFLALNKDLLSNIKLDEYDEYHYIEEKDFTFHKIIFIKNESDEMGLDFL